MSIPFLVLGFKPMTSSHETPPITTRPGLPPFLYKLFAAVQVIKIYIVDPLRGK